MAYVEQVSGNTGPAAAVRAAIGALAHSLSGVLIRRHGGLRHTPGPLGAATMQDIGARRQYQDYAPSRIVPGCPDQRLDRIANVTRWASPR